MQGINYTGMYTTEIKGSAPAIGYESVLTGYIENRLDEHLLTWVDQRLKKSQTIDGLITEILSVFHRDNEGNICLGGWQVAECMLRTGLAFFNAIKKKEHPSKTQIPHLVGPVEPNYIPLLSPKGEYITDLQKAGGYVNTVAMTTMANGKPRSFFKAYETLPAGTTFTCTCHTDEEFVPEELFKWWIKKTGSVGNYAWRRRYGKFEVTFNE